MSVSDDFWRVEKPGDPRRHQQLVKIIEEFNIPFWTDESRWCSEFEYKFKFYTLDGKRELGTIDVGDYPATKRGYKDEVVKVDEGGGVGWFLNINNTPLEEYTWRHEHNVPAMHTGDSYLIGGRKPWPKVVEIFRSYVKYIFENERAFEELGGKAAIYEGEFNEHFWHKCRPKVIADRIQEILTDWDYIHVRIGGASVEYRITLQTQCADEKVRCPYGSIKMDEWWDEDAFTRRFTLQSRNVTHIAISEDEILDAVRCHVESEQKWRDK